MESTGRAPIVVGIDGSSSANRAAVWAAEEAVARHSPLNLVYAYEWAADEGPGRVALRANARYRDVFLLYAQDRIREATERIRTAVPEVELTTELVVGQPTHVLTERSADAALMVLGSRGLGGVSGLLLGSVAVGLVAHAKCPVVVVRGDERHPEVDLTSEAGAPVVVGLDGSPMSEAALAFAYEAASAYGSPLVAVHAWQLSTEDSRLLPYVDMDMVQDEEERLLAEQTAGWGEKYPDVIVRREVVKGRPGRILLEHSAGARLLVVGARGRGGAAGLLLGSTSQALIHRAECPVAVIRPREDRT
ncbi:MAG TPA: universal stress protein [Pseudonocardia sp.]|jgi:nucleotide-binding universal stress UspA family protein|nr:universal stress protein [Pseudonocardia sp.]